MYIEKDFPIIDFLGFGGLLNIKEAFIQIFTDSKTSSQFLLSYIIFVNASHRLKKQSLTHGIEDYYSERLGFLFTPSFGIVYPLLLTSTYKDLYHLKRSNMRKVLRAWNVHVEKKRHWKDFMLLFLFDSSSL